MMNDGILHLVEPRGAGCGPCTLAQVGTRAEREQARVVVLGSSRDAQLAVDSGCRVDAWVPLPLGMPRLASSSLSRVWAQGREARVMAWSEGAAAAGALLPADVHVQATISAVFGSTPWIEPWRRARVEVLGVGREMGRVLSARNWRVGPGVAVESCGRPAIGECPNRTEIRREWGAAEEEIVVACIADPPEAINLTEIFNAVFVASICGCRIRVVAHPSSRRVQQMYCQSRLIAENQEFADIPLILDERLQAPWLVAHGVDILVQALRPGRELIERASLIPVTWWMSAGVVSLVSNLAGAQEVISSGVDGVVLEKTDRNELSSCIMRYCEDSELRRNVSEAARNRWSFDGASTKTLQVSPASC